MDTEEIKTRVSRIHPWLVSVRRDFHMYPELGMEEFRTSEKIVQYLAEMGIECTKGIAKTGVVGLIRGGRPGKTIAVRADMDALPLDDRKAIPYKSQVSGKMHACGHDAHMAILLGTAKVLSEIGPELGGNVKLLFQPAEETDGGAEPMIREGCMENPKVDYVIGLHVMPNVATGTVEVKYGKLNAATDTVHITVTGSSAHGAAPQNGTDAIVIAAQVVSALQTLVSRSIAPVDSVVFTIGTIQGGVKSNIIPEQVKMTATLRTLTPGIRSFAIGKITKMVEHICAAMGGVGEVFVEQGYPPLINHSPVLDVIVATAAGLLGKENVITKEFPSLGAEDFSYFLDHAPGAFYHLGCGNKEKQVVAPAHSPDFDIDEDCLPVGVLLQAAIVLNLLGAGE